MVWEKLGTASVSGTTANTSWKELARITAGSGGSSELTTSTFTAKDNLMILYNSIGADPQMRVGYSSIDTGGNYCQRSSENGGSDGTQTSSPHNAYWYVNGGAGATGNEHVFGVTEAVNVSAQEKLFTLNSADNASGTGAGTAPGRYERAMKWANTSNQINIARMFSSGTMAEGSEMVVLGMDNDEADSGTNFWQELVNVELSATANEINSGTFTAKKYLMIELQVIADGSISGSDLQFNGDTGSNYARRYRTGGDSEATGTSEATLGGGTGGDRGYNTWFIVNVADKEKLAIGEAVWGSNGAGNAPSRRELTGKWANTSNQITSIKIKENGSGGWASGSTLKVWGAD